MEFRDVIDGMKERIYESLPRQNDVWENDVWEGIVRPNYARAYRNELMKHVNGDLASDAAITAFETVRTDLFRRRVLDVVDATISQFVPAPENTDPFELVEVLELLREHAGYKFYKWASLTQLEELITLCERIPRIHVGSYAATINGAVGLLAHSAAVLECDVDTKPNFATMRHRVKLFSALNRFGSRLLSAFDDQGSS